MKKTRVIQALAGLILVGTTSIAAVQDELPIASPDKMFEIRQFCVRLAWEEEVPKGELEGFMLDCVNYELTSDGFNPVEMVRGPYRATPKVMNEIRGICSEGTETDEKPQEERVSELLECINTQLDALGLVVPKNPENEK